MRHATRFCTLLVVMLFFSACDITAPPQEREISRDKDVDALVAMVGNRSMTHGVGLKPDDRPRKGFISPYQRILLIHTRV